MKRSRHPSPQTTAVLLALAEDPSAWHYGYELCQQTDLKAGSMYPILMRLADRGLLETAWESDVPMGRPPRHLYRLTGQGLELAAELAAPPARAAKAERLAATATGGRMKRTERRYELVVSAAVVAVFAAFWVIVFAMGDPPEYQSQYVFSAVMVAVVATPWVIAVRLLWRAWWARTAASLSTMDGPARLLAAAVATLPDDRRDWGAAMAAELAQVRGRSSRWWFAAGCARAAVFPPRSSRVPVLVVGALAAAAVVTAGPAVGYALPAMRVFAVTLVALVGALATLAVARSRRVRQAVPGPTITAAGVAGVAACIALTAYFLVKHPTAAEHLPPTAAVIFAVVLTGCLWLALTPPRGLTTNRLARGLGAGAALALGLGFLLTSRLTINTYGGPWVWVMFAPVVIFFAASAVAAAVGRSFRAGVQAAVWTALVGTLLVYAISLPEAIRRYAIDGRTLGDGELGYPIGVNLPGAIWVLVAIPVLGLPCGVIGAAIGRPARAAPPLGPFLAENLSMVTFIVVLGALFALQAGQAGMEPLPAPTGPHKTGRVSFHWQDAARAELETSAPDDKRELMVHLFYPADASASGARSLYIPDADAMRGRPWNDEQVARITALRAFSRDNAALPRGTARYPVVVFAPGGGMKGLTYHVLLEDLASHGWVVAAIDPPYNARAVRLPDGRVLGNLQPAERGWPETRNREERLRYYQERIVHWCRDVSFVIDQLTVLDRGNGPFARCLDLERGVGVFGHSRGGQAAGAVRLLDERVRGGINLDGTAGEYAILPVKGEEVSGSQPFLWIQGSLPPPPTEAQLQRAGKTRAFYDADLERVMASWRRQLGAVTGGAMRVSIDRPGIAHIDFSDEPFWDGSMTADTRPGKLKTIADTRAWVRAFFDGTVRGDWADLKRLAGEAGKSQPEVTVHVFGRMWP